MNDRPPDTSENAASMAEMMVELGAGVSVLLTQRLAVLELTLAKLRVLRMVEQRAGLSQQALASRLGIAASRVAKLVAEGRTNREVAAALFLDERTVASHLTHIYVKLGVRSRTELARKLGRDEPL